MIPFTACLHCSGVRFVAGPRGGSAQNVACLGCSAVFNLIIPPLTGPFLLFEELAPPTGKPIDYPRQAGTYIIELIKP
jgi:hypothetical protein